MQALKKSVIAALIAAVIFPMTAMSQTDTQTSAGVSTVGIMPNRGMTMEQVKQSFGNPAKIISAVGHPPITRWRYDGFVVYFESTHVIHALAIADNQK